MRPSDGGRGSRRGEHAQLRAADIIYQDGVHAMKITPEAGMTKTGTRRTVPLHEHLIEQGFLDFVKASGQGHLFYNERKGPVAPFDPINPRRARSVKVREHVAEWVCGVGVTDPELLPNYAWRRTFRAIADRCQPGAYDQSNGLAAARSQARPRTSCAVAM
jgi:integrase